MRIESSKTNQAEKRAEREAAAEKRRTSSAAPPATFQTLFKTGEKKDVPPARFAEILKEARHQTVKDSFFERETDRAGEHSLETDEARRKDEDSGAAIHHQEKVEEERERREDGGEQSDERESNPSFTAPNFHAAAKNSAETTPPAARSILHVADLERIVSTVRSQNLKNAEQVVIGLKHSVLEGLQIRLTIDESGTLKAEFLAVNEQIKNHLDARKEEIIQIFRERGVKLSDLNVRQDSKFDSQANDLEAVSSSSSSASGAASDEKESERSAQKDDDEQTSYRV